MLTNKKAEGGSKKIRRVPQEEVQWEAQYIGRITVRRIDSGRFEQPVETVPFKHKKIRRVLQKNSPDELPVE